MNTFGSTEYAFTDHPVADLKALHQFADFDDFAGPFVARPDRIGNRDDVSPGQELVVGMTDSDGGGADQNLVVLELGHWHFGDDWLVGSFENESLHDVSS